jgi:hypothetical protein
MSFVFSLFHVKTSNLIESRTKAGEHFVEINNENLKF